MKTIFKTALILGLASFAFFASAQTITIAPGANSPTIVTESDTMQVDFVTVGSTMPYATDLDQVSFTAWRDTAIAWGLNLANVTSVASWATRQMNPMPTSWLDGPSATNNQEQIFVTWSTVGDFELRLTNRIQISGADACTPAVSTKRVYVLPEPSVRTAPATIVGHDVIRHCTTAVHTVSFVAVGIGQKQLRYQITRRSIDGGGPETPVVSNAGGTAMSSPVFFTMANTAFATAEAFYGPGATGEDVISIEIPVEAGYVYRVQVLGVSDQISRKSFTGDYVFRPANVQAVFAVVPTPTSTVIEHVSNLQGVVAP